MSQTPVLEQIRTYSEVLVEDLPEARVQRIEPEARWSRARGWLVAAGAAAVVLLLGLVPLLLFAGDDDPAAEPSATLPTAPPSTSVTPSTVPESTAPPTTIETPVTTTPTPTNAPASTTVAGPFGLTLTWTQLPDTAEARSALVEPGRVLMSSIDGGYVFEYPLVCGGSDPSNFAGEPCELLRLTDTFTWATEPVPLAPSTSGHFGHGVTDGHIWYFEAAGFFEGEVVPDEFRYAYHDGRQWLQGTVTPPAGSTDGATDVRAHFICLESGPDGSSVVRFVDGGDWSGLGEVLLRRDGSQEDIDFGPEWYECSAGGFSGGVSGAESDSHALRIFEWNGGVPQWTPIDLNLPDALGTPIGGFRMTTGRSFIQDRRGLIWTSSDLTNWEVTAGLPDPVFVPDAEASLYMGQLDPWTIERTDFGWIGFAVDQTIMVSRDGVTWEQVATPTPIESFGFHSGGLVSVWFNGSGQYAFWFAHIDDYSRP